MATIEVTEFTDPGCVWSWSSEPKLRRLRRQYGDRVAWRRVFGIQIDDVKLSFPDRDPVDGAEEWRADWLAVAAHSGAPITSRLEWMHSSTWPASRAAKAAEAQGDDVADAVLRRLREAVFVDGRSADNPERIALALSGVPGLDLDWLLEDLDSDAVSEAIAKDAGVADISGYTDYGRVWSEFEQLVEDDLHPRATVIVLGDARTNGRDPRADVFARVTAKAGRTFWLNPEPRLYWNYGDSVIAAYERHCEAFECWTTGQLEDFVKALTQPVQVS